MMTDSEKMVWAAAFASRFNDDFDVNGGEVLGARIAAASHARDVVVAMRASVPEVEAHPGLDAEVAPMLREMVGGT